MKPHRVSLSLALATFAGVHCAWGQMIVTRHFTVNQSIPDGGELLNAQTLDLGGGTISDVRVSLNISRGSVGPGFNGDLYAALSHGTGYSVLINRPGRTASDDFGYADGEGFNVTFADSGANDVHNYRVALSGNPNTALTGSLTGLWQPDGRNIDPNEVLNTDSRTKMLSTFNGVAANGQWRLFLSDVSVGGLSKLQGWDLVVTTTGNTGISSALNGDTLEFTASGSTFNNTATLAGSNTIQGENGATLSGNLSGAGGLSHSGSGTVVLSGANTFSGGVTANSGTLALGNNQALGSGTLTLNGGTIASSGGTRTLSNPVAITGSSTIAGTDRVELSGNTTLTGTHDLTVNAPTTMSGVISESTSGLGLVKKGAGNLTLTAANTFTGGMTVSGGALVVNNTTGSATGSGNVTVNTGATLSGGGRISGAVILQSGAGISPGNSPGTLYTGSETWAGGGSYTWEINRATATAGSDPGWDLLNISGGLNVSATSENKFQINITSLTLANTAGTVHNFSSASTYAWTIVTTGTGIVGFDALKFNLDKTQFQNGLGGGGFSLSLANGDKDMVLNFTAVPEPGHYAIVVGLGLVTFAISRRRRSGGL